MSPLFGKHHDAGDEADPPQTDWRHLPRLAEIGPQLDQVASEVAAMPLPALAAKLMTELFGSEYAPRGNGVDVDSIASPLIQTPVLRRWVTRHHRVPTHCGIWPPRRFSCSSRRG